MRQNKPLTLKNEALYIMAYTVVFLFVALWVGGPLRSGLGIPMALFIPGYSIVSAMFPEKEPVSGWRRLGLSLLLQLLLVTGLGFVMNFTPWGLRLYPVLVLNSAIVLVSEAVAHYRRLKVPEERRFELTVPLPGDWRGEHAKPDKVLSVVVFVTAAIAVGAFVYAAGHPLSKEKVTELYILGPDGRAGNYGQAVKVGEETALTVSVVNREQGTMTYELRMVVDGAQEGDLVSTGALMPGSRWDKQMYYIPTTPGVKKVEFLLYLADQREPYRKTHLWVNVTEE